MWSFIIMYVGIYVFFNFLSILYKIYSRKWKK